jgi:hypothetical protein
VAVQDRPTLAPETEEVVDEERQPLVEEPQDVSPEDMLTEQSVPVSDYFTLPNGKKLKLTSITERELGVLTDRSKKPDKTDPRRPPRVDALTLRRNMVAYSISKAANRIGTPQEIIGQHLLDIPPGLITELQRKVQELSGFVEDRQPAPDPMAFFG